MAYNHRSIGLVERWHSTIKTMLAAHKRASGSSEWPVYLPLLQLAFNTAVGATTGYSPFFINHLRHAVLPVDYATTTRDVRAVATLPDWVATRLDALQVTYDVVAQKLKSRALSAKRAWDLRHDSQVSFSVGDRVLIIAGTVIDGKHPKAVEPTLGPYTVCKVLERNNYQLSDMQTRRMSDKVNISRLIAFPSRRVYSELDERQRYPVQSIASHRSRTIPVGDRSELSDLAGSTVIEYRIRWRGFARNYDSWRATRYLSDVFDLVTAYRQVQMRNGVVFADFVPQLAVVSRDVTGIPAVAAPAVTRAHFRSQVSGRRLPLEAGATLPALTTTSTVTPDPAPLLQLTAAEAPVLPRLQLTAVEAPAPPDAVHEDASADSSRDAFYSGLGDVYPAGSQLRIRHGESGWWRCEVMRTFVSRPRTSGRPPERRVVVEYTAPGYGGELVEHGLRGTPVEVSYDCGRTWVRPPPAGPEREQPALPTVEEAASDGEAEPQPLSSRAAARTRRVDAAVKLGQPGRGERTVTPHSPAHGGSGSPSDSSATEPATTRLAKRLLTSPARGQSAGKLEPNEPPAAASVPRH